MQSQTLASRGLICIVPFLRTTFANKKAPNQKVKHLILYCMLNFVIYCRVLTAF
nr:MAG TPA: hypothetical protein [Caudoviricetes sp.]DAJ57288.1 MAG TPA: hypothetical protein [Caudoviricetes sp.]